MKKLSILVILNNGEPIDIMIVEKIFAGLNIIPTVISVQGCFTYMAMNRPDLVIIDEQITYQFTIYRFLNLFKSNKATASIPLAVLGLMEKKEDIINGGAFFYLKKPLDTSQLMELLNAMVKKNNEN